MNERSWQDTSLLRENALDVGRFALRHAIAGDLDVLVTWMNDPAVDAYWKLAGPRERTAAHLRAQKEAGHVTSLLGCLDGVPMSYWEVYWADLDPLSAAYPARAYDGGIHLLLGPATARGRGLGATLLRDVSDRMFAAAPACERIVAEPDIRNRPSIGAFERAGFQRQADLALPDKWAALMVRERTTISTEEDA
ncbi:GNAT family N-acetyltransferase [Actinopolymorpha alba]|uniref:GNAT family N-acetyltransferase n=1 Tax=Actinopolymorpha alba TaxID=533267 RepID=UPI00037503E9|nr:GNAT family N-acetyltransferase [Actinopolymorpha alba]